MFIGIDFGTCFSSVAFMNGHIPVTDYISDYNRMGVPTLFMYSKKSNKELFGCECTTVEATLNSADVIKYMKKIIRENPNNLNATVQSGGNNYKIKDVVKKFLTYLIDQAKEAGIKSGEFTNTNIEGITITAPVGIADGHMTATDYKKLLVTTVTEITGLDQKNVKVLEEPVAAAISYLYSENIKKKYKDNQTILVFDLGGGTLDTTIVEYKPVTNEYNIKIKEGDLKLGGNDWDEALGQAVLKKIGIKQDFTSKEEKTKFQSAIIRLKQELSYIDETGIVFKYNGSTKIVEFTRDEFETASKHLLDRAIAVTKKAIESFSKNGVSAIDKIILVGGSSNMPQIRNRMLSEFPKLGETKIIAHDPSKAIAKGAAIFTKIDVPTIKNETASTTLVLEPKINDIASHTYGFDSRNLDIQKDMIYNLLFKNTPFDASGKIVETSKICFVALENSQTIITFHVYESTALLGEGKLANWMDYGLDEHANGMKVTVNIPEEYLGRATEYSTWVTFCLDKNGILEIIIKDANGKQVGYDRKQV